MEITPIPASQPGALSGFEAVCSSCGMALRSSLRTLIVSDIAAHQRWHESQREAIPMPARSDLRDAAHTLDLAICALEDGPDRSDAITAAADTLRAAYEVLAELTEVDG
jgi:hypothetical protein